MDLDDVLETENHIQAREKVDEKDIKELLQRKYYNLRALDGKNNSCPPRNSMPARLHNVDGKDSKMLKREFQNSREVKNLRMRKLKNKNNAKKSVEHAFNDEAFLSFEVVDPLPQPSPNQESTEFLELSLRDISEERVKLSSSCSGSSKVLDLEDNAVEHNSCTIEKRQNMSVEEQNSKRNTKSNLPKSFSVKEVILNSPCESEAKDSPKSRFSPFKKIFDPIMKSKSLRNPSLIENLPSMKRHRAFRKSLMNDFSKAAEKMDYDTGPTEQNHSILASSPAYLHATLNCDFKHGALSYEFAIQDREDVLIAKTWRTDSAFNWVYTFHNMKKKINLRCGKSTPIVGQMQVSCYLCSEVNDAGSLESSTVTEFVLYDIAQARRSFATEEECKRSSNSNPTLNDFDSDPSNSYPWALSDLHPYLEIASMVIQIPFNNKKEMKEQQVEEDTTFECMNHANVKAVIPSGPHGLPNNEEDSPSSLLDRWRYGGGCDCGGWDMACPIDVLDKPCTSNVIDYSVKESQPQILLFVQGRKEKIPAVSITSDGRGQYTVDFHAQLSSLQAFSICISILHGSEAFSALSHEKTQRLYSNSLKLILEEEVKRLLDTVAEEEKQKSKEKIRQHPPSFMLGTPFSPMGRV